MRFMMMIKTPEAGPPSVELLAAVGKLSQEMAAAGILLEAGGLASSAKGARVRLAGAKVTVLDGPFTESKDVSDLCVAPGLGRPVPARPAGAPGTPVGQLPVELESMKFAL